jgi:hypothetical protein
LASSSSIFTFSLYSFSAMMLYFYPLRLKAIVENLTAR